MHVKGGCVRHHDRRHLMLQIHAHEAVKSSAATFLEEVIQPVSTPDVPTERHRDQGAFGRLLCLKEQPSGGVIEDH